MELIKSNDRFDSTEGWGDDAAALKRAHDKWDRRVRTARLALATVRAERRPVATVRAERRPARGRSVVCRRVTKDALLVCTQGDTATGVE